MMTKLFCCRQAADQKLDRDKKHLEADKKEQEARKKFKVSVQHAQFERSWSVCISHTLSGPVCVC